MNLRPFDSILEKLGYFIQGYPRFLSHPFV